MKLKKGFTLIELLAVIIILAVIALIATPIVLNIVDNAKLSAFNSSANYLIDAIRYYYSEELINKPKMDGIVINLSESKETNFPYEIEKMNFGEVKISSTGESTFYMSNGKYCAIKSYEDKNPTIFASKNCSWDDIINVMKPKLSENMIPVKYDETVNSWVITKEDDWYNYEQGIWANAITVNEKASTCTTCNDTNEKHDREYYLNKNNIGQKISMDDINTMWVWIPRYAYQIQNSSDIIPASIKIQFLSGNENIKEGYRIHPAFGWDDNHNGTIETDEILDGIWIGKFETSGSITKDCVNENCTTSQLYIKPSQRSVGGQYLSSLFMATRSMQKEGNIYGFSQTGSNVHLIKNSEWTAAAYLAQSMYGKYGNPLYDKANKEVYQNNSSVYYTGRSAGSPSGKVTKIEDHFPDVEVPGVQGISTEGGYYTYDGKVVNSDGTIGDYASDRTKGYGASTTGNIYGIYDMSGGGFENVMGNFNHYIGFAKNWWGYSGFNGFYPNGSEETTSVPFPTSEYFDLFTSDTGEYDPYKACHNDICYGQATTETIGWYNDLNNKEHYMNSSYPFLLRGGYSGDNNSAGIFNLDRTNGMVHERFTSRATMIIK